MTVPGWLDPDPDPREEPDDHGGQDEHRPAGDGDLPAGDEHRPAGDGDLPAGDEHRPAGDGDLPPDVTGIEELAEKPVLEWTTDDWTRWIDSADHRPLPAPPGGAGQAPDADDEPSDPPEPPAAEVGTPGAAEADVEVTADGEVGTEAAPELEVRVAREPEDESGALAEPDDPPASHVTAAVVDGEPDEEPDGVDRAPPSAGPEPPEWATAVEPVVAALEEPEPATAMVDLGAVDDPVAPAASGDETDAGGGDWAGVADHPWWESAPVIDDSKNVIDRDQPTRAEPAVAPFGVATRPPHPGPAPAYPSTSTGATTRTARPAPAPRVERAVPRPPVTAPVPSHRVRSAFGLLGVAVMVGMVVAGLITVAIFAISVALRHAVG